MKMEKYIGIKKFNTTMAKRFYFGYMILLVCFFAIVIISAFTVSYFGDNDNMRSLNAVSHTFPIMGAAIGFMFWMPIFHWAYSFLGE